MGINSVVTMTITRSTTTPSRAGFGLPCISAYTTVFPERYRLYSSLLAMVADGFAVTDKAYLAATGCFAQTPRPSQVMIGRTARDNPMAVDITPVSTDLRASYAYTVYHNGLAATYTTDASPTVAEICAGLAAAIDPAAWAGTTAYALGDYVKNDTGPVKIYVCTTAGTSAGAGGPTGTNAAITDGTVVWAYVGPQSALTATDNTTKVTVAETAAGDNMQLYPAEWDILDMNDVTTDGGIATDLSAIRAQYDDWYCLIPTNQGKAVLTACAAAIEAYVARKVMIASTIDSDCYDSTSTTDIAAALQTAGYDRTMLMYHYKANSQFPCAAWAGLGLPQDAGTLTWAYKTLAGVDYMELGDTRESAIEGKDANYYTRMAGVSITQTGKVSGDEWFDIMRGTDALESEIQSNVFTGLVNSPKIPFTDVGASSVENRVRQGLKAFTVTTDNPNRLLKNNPAPTVTVPLVSTVSDANKGNRILPDVEFVAYYAGAIHKVQIQGNISL